MNDSSSAPLACDAAIIGGGPAGLMAAEILAQAGHSVHVFDAMPSVGRKFLLAGKGGLNLTHSEPFEAFVSRFGERRAQIEPLLSVFGAEQLRAWAQGLGVDTFVGTSGRVFPTDMKAAPLLRAWLARLRAAGVVLHMRHRWLGWDADGALCFASAAGQQRVAARATVLALGGASWPRLGSDAAWVPLLAARGVQIAPLQPANCGFDVPRVDAPVGHLFDISRREFFRELLGRGQASAVGWTPFFAERFAGQPFKSVAIAFTDSQGRQFARRGEFVATATGVEGSLVYAASGLLRDEITAHGHATFHLDLLPDHSPERVLAEVRHPRGARSLTSHLKGRLGLDGIKAAILYEQLGKVGMQDAQLLAQAIKRLPITVLAMRPVQEAISTAGGVSFEALDAHLMLRAMPGVFCAGEMLDWEAPTGGYLLTACCATGRVAGAGAVHWLASPVPADQNLVR
ncbi:MAG TPA: TIGR03862 family flavoprotein [Alicycliphilus sp.]|nr:TIGR03862 family flavoprotein [Alicycliphilus sp.]HRO53263.1 TIGR03862 family flavoprotein [Alicycliphilus sp.]HRP21176.1 TIGR03862 family flavoprotein [Alicycliphilus sp.]